MRWLLVFFVAAFSPFALSEGAPTAPLDLNPHLHFQPVDESQTPEPIASQTKRVEIPSSVMSSEQLKFPPQFPGANATKESEARDAHREEKFEESPLRKQMDISPEDMNVYHGKGTAVTPMGGSTD